VVFHSLRHSSTTYKLKLNHGDLKATQGDTGHAEIEMITKIYAHILDEDRKVNAQRFESAFYMQPKLNNIQSLNAAKPSKQDVNGLVEQLASSTEFVNALASMIVARSFTGNFANSSC